MSETEEFLGLSASNTPMRPSDVRTRKKLLLVFLAWLAGFLIACPDPRAVACIPFFPLGLIEFICAGVDKHGDAYVLLALGWILYVALTTTTLVMGRRRWFYVLWSILTVLLLLNGAGCHAILQGLKEIR
jgi:hypothetical protein